MYSSSFLLSFSLFILFLGYLSYLGVFIPHIMYQKLTKKIEKCHLAMVLPPVVFLSLSSPSQSDIIHKNLSTPCLDLSDSFTNSPETVAVRDVFLLVIHLARVN